MVFIFVLGLLLFGASLSNARIRSEVAKGFREFLSNVGREASSLRRQVEVSDKFDLFSPTKASPPLSRLTIGRPCSTVTLAKFTIVPLAF
jgi:hypothetical protein